MRKIAHIINPFRAPDKSDLRTGQPITWQTIRIAKDFAEDLMEADIQIDLYATIYPDDQEILPKGFTRTKDLIRSISSIGKFKIGRELPLVRDILSNLYDASDADYFIQTNSDICLMPQFYLAVNELIERGNDAFIINRRCIPDHYKDINDIPIMYAEIGAPHGGCDCFVFPRSIFPAYKIGNVCMGIPWQETTLATSMAFYAQNCKMFTEAHLTFHIGDPRIWRNIDYLDYRVHNTNEFAKVLVDFKKKKPKIMQHPIVQYFMTKLKGEVQGYKNEGYSKDCWRLVK